MKVAACLFFLPFYVAQTTNSTETVSAEPPLPTQVSEALWFGTTNSTVITDKSVAIGKGKCYNTNRPAKHVKTVPPVGSEGVPLEVGPNGFSYQRIANRLKGFKRPSPELSFADNCLEAHNLVRGGVLGMNNLAWDANLAASAQNWANILTVNHGGAMIHSPEAKAGRYGENLWGGPSDVYKCDSAVIVSWFGEYSLYPHGSFPQYGHFTQIATKDVKKVGCGVTSNIIACHYDAGQSGKDIYVY